MSKPKHYHRMTAREQQQYRINAVREPAVACPHCETSTTVDDLLTHVADRCEGERPPHRLGAWIPRRTALRLGASPYMLNKWTKRGRVRERRKAGKSVYLKRDLVRAIAVRTKPRKRKPT